MTLPALDKTPVSTRTNRGALLLVGLLLLATGVLGLVLSFGGFGSSVAQRAVLDPGVRSFAATHEWFWLVAAAVALVVAVLSLLWLRTQLSTNRLRSIDLEPDRSQGTTTLPTAAVERACEQILEARRGIGRAGAVMLGTEQEPRLALVVTLDGRERLRQVDHVVLTDVLPDVRAVLGNSNLPVRVEYRLAGRVTRSPR